MEPFTLVLLAIFILGLQRLLAAFPPSSWTPVLPLYLKLTGNTTFKQLVAKKQERAQCHAEKNKLSPQDQYAKWTKLNRKSDALSKEIAQLEESLLGTKAQLDNNLGMLTTALTISSYGLRFWYRSKPVFYFPQDTLPYLLERLLAFPSLPIGAVGFGQWLFFLGTFLTGVTFIVTNLTKKIEDPNLKQSTPAPSAVSSAVQ